MPHAASKQNVSTRFATSGDVPLIHSLIGELAEYERLAHEMIATPDDLARSLFGPKPAAEVLIGDLNGEAAGFALFFHNFSTFLGKPGIYLEDLYVRPAARGHGLGELLLRRLATLADERGCGRLEWAVLDWNQPAIGFYRKLGAQAMEDWTVFRVAGQALQDLANHR